MKPDNYFHRVVTINILLFRIFHGYNRIAHDIGQRSVLSLIEAVNLFYEYISDNLEFLSDVYVETIFNYFDDIHNTSRNKDILITIYVLEKQIRTAFKQLVGDLKVTPNKQIYLKVKNRSNLIKRDSNTMMSFQANKLLIWKDIDELKKGDILRIRNGGYYHYGVYFGDDIIVHYFENNGETILSRTSKEYFLNNKMFKVLEQDIQNIVIEKINFLLGSDDYDIIFNNCEHLLFYLVSGEFYSTYLYRMLRISKNIKAYRVLNRILLEIENE